MRVLVTGAGGFVGEHLISALLNNGHEVFAGGLHSASTVFRSEKGIEYLKFDITDNSMVKNIIGEVKPDGIIHLAAQSKVNTSWEDPANTILVNTIGTINLINAVKDNAPDARIINIGTSEEYGLTGKLGKPLDESQPCLPQNPYAISKLAAGQLALQLAYKEKLNVIHVRPFNHFGPGQQIGYAVSDFSSQITMIERGICPPQINVGDLSTQRDFSDVRDVVSAYISLLEGKVENGIYNVCSGTPHSINEILHFLVQQAKIPIAIKIDQGKFRPSDVPLFVGSNSKLEKTINWRAKRLLTDSLLETLDWWRTQDWIDAASFKK